MYKKYMVRGIFIMVFILLFIFLLLYPCKRTIKESVALDRDLEEDQIAILCEQGSVTDPVWYVLDTTEERNYIGEFINISGDVPANKLKYPFYVYETNKFVFIGKFESKDTFRVDKWEVVNKIKRSYILTDIFFPNYGFNIFEYRI